MGMGEELLKIMLLIVFFPVKLVDIIFNGLEGSGGNAWDVIGRAIVVSVIITGIVAVCMGLIIPAVILFG